MRVRGIVEEDFSNYKNPSMFIISCFCDFKCCTESGLDIGVCQNAQIVKSKMLDVHDEIIYNRFSNNPITKAVVIGGLEPFAQIDEVESLLRKFREHGDYSPFVIYTGYYPDEIKRQIELLSRYKNVVIKFGRYKPGEEAHFDEVLGVSLASHNQYAVKIS